jgi:thiol-disulfide isomerase/thioredoxin
VVGCPGPVVVGLVSIYSCDLQDGTITSDLNLRECFARGGIGGLGMRVLSIHAAHVAKGVAVLGLLSVLAEGAGCGPLGSARLPVAGIGAEEIREQLLSQPGEVTLLHFWATWCAPCVHEFPVIVKLRQAYHRKGLRVIVVSMDREESRGAVNAFLTEHGVDWQTYMASEVTAGFIEGVSTTWSGAIPASFFYGPDGQRLDGWEAARSYGEYVQVVEQLLKWD